MVALFGPARPLPELPGKFFGIVEPRPALAPFFLKRGSLSSRVVFVRIYVSEVVVDPPAAVEECGGAMGGSSPRKV